MQNEDEKFNSAMVFHILQVGSARCIDFKEDTCILPQLGSLSNTTGKYYNKEDYQEILRYADEHHVQVIPEIDMPGHANAAIKSMEKRYQTRSYSWVRLIGLYTILILGL